MRLCELKEKEVVNIQEHKCLGRVMDLEFNERDGCIVALIVPDPGKFFGCLMRNMSIGFPGARLCASAGHRAGGCVPEECDRHM